MASFSMVVVTAFYVVYFKTVIAGGSAMGDLWWGAAISISMAVVAVISPVLGAIADSAQKKRAFLIGFAMTCILSTCMLSLLRPGMVAAGMILFILAYSGYTGSMPFYNGFLMEIAPRDQWPRVSGIGWGIGYFGGLISLVALVPLAGDALNPGGEGSAALILAGAAMFFLVCAAPSFLLLRDAGDGQRQKQPGAAGYVRDGFSRLLETFRTARSHRDLWKFLVAFFLFNDAITTVIAFFAVYARDSLGFSMKGSVLLLMLVQVTAAIGAFLTGPLAKTAGLKGTVVAGLAIWIAAAVAAGLSASQAQFTAVSVVAGLALGGTQAAARSLVAELAPEGKQAEIFGFMTLCGRAAAIAGPLIFGAVSVLTGSQRPAILSVVLFFAAGLAVTLTVKR
jgi:UMF1 family MFS transporter